MTIELRPMGVACNLGCTYCYQEPQREAGNINTKYNIEAMLAEADKVLATVQDPKHKVFNLFGGEALLIPKRDLERFWKHGFEKYGQNGLQTNGTLMDDEHIEMFKKYNVHVGVSIDGPGELNMLREVRANRSLEKTLDATQVIINNIIKLVKAGLKPGVIITLHGANASAEKLPKLLEFIRWLGDNGIPGGNIHTLEVDTTMPDQAKWVLPQEENAKVFKTLAQFFENNPDLKWNPFTEYSTILMGDDRHVTCYWKNCDPLNTKAVYGIEGNGGLSNCGRTAKEGIDWYKADDISYARYISFYNTPDEMGGCKGCRFWMACGGSCPGEAQDSDFRNKTIHCHTQKELLTYYEEKLEERGIQPISKSYKRPIIEKIMLDHFARGQEMTITHALHIIQQVESKGSQVSVGQPREDVR